MNSKGVELSINVIVVIAIALMIAVVFFIIFTSQSGEFNKTILSCELKGGTCVKQGECQNQKTSWSCPKKELPECCVNNLGK